MITVAILINGQPLVARSATNESERNEKGETLYHTDSGDLIWHARHEGAVVLAKKMLDTIREAPPWRPSNLDEVSAKMTERRG